MRVALTGCLAATLLIGVSAADAKHVNAGYGKIGAKDCTVGGLGYIKANHRYRAPLSGRTGTWHLGGGKLHINYDNGEYGWGQIGVINGQIIMGGHVVSC
jgi:hypothetical protein